MSRQRTTHCSRGHLRTDSNTSVSKDKKGFTVRRCKMCASIRDKKRYRENPKRAAYCRAKVSLHYYLKRRKPHLNHVKDHSIPAE